MEPFFILGAFTAASIVYVFRRSSKREREAAFAHVADTYNLTVMNPKRLEGDVQGYRVSVTMPSHAQVRVELKGLLVSTVSIANESTAKLDIIHYRLFEHEVGDEIFDALAHIQGDERLLAALLSASVRKTITHLIKTYGAVLDRGAITCAVHSQSQAVRNRVSRVDLDGLGHALADPMSECIEKAVGCAELMYINEEDQPRRICENVLTDPSEEFRLWCFNVLIRFYRDHPIFSELVSTCVSHGSPGVRLKAASYVSEGGFSALRKIALDDSIETHLRLEALWKATNMAAPDAAGEMAVACLKGAMIPEAIRVIDKSGYRPGIQPIIQLIGTRDAADGAFADASRDLIVSTLCRFGGPDILFGLARILDTSHGPIDATTSTQMSAAFDLIGTDGLAGLITILRTDHGAVNPSLLKALSRVGNLETIPELIAAKMRLQQHKGYSSKVLQKAYETVNQSIRNIQERHGVQATEGGLSTPREDHLLGGLTTTMNEDDCDDS